MECKLLLSRHGTARPHCLQALLVFIAAMLAEFHERSQSLFTCFIIQHGCHGFSRYHSLENTMATHLYKICSICVFSFFLILKKLAEEGEEIDDETEDMFYLKRLDAGLFTLQLIDCVMLEACCSGVPSVNKYKSLKTKAPLYCMLDFLSDII